MYIVLYYFLYFSQTQTESNKFKIRLKNPSLLTLFLTVLTKPVWKLSWPAYRNGLESENKILILASQTLSYSKMQLIWTPVHKPYGGPLDCDAVMAEFQGRVSNQVVYNQINSIQGSRKVYSEK